MSPRRKSRWYGAEGQSHIRQISAQQTGSLKRLLGLIVLLALVLILIQKASDAKRVEQVGKAIGLFEPKQIPQEVTTDPGSQALGSHSEGIPHPIETSSKPTPLVEWEWEQLQLRSGNDERSVYQQIWTRLLALGQTDHIAEKIVDWQNQATEGSEPLDPGTWAGLAAEQLNSWMELFIEEPQSARDVERLRQMRSELLDFDAFLRRDTNDSSLEANVLYSKRAFLIALNRAILTSFKDGEPWRSSERVASLQQWKRCSLLRSSIGKSIRFIDVPRVEVMQLVSSNNIAYRGVPIRFRGTIAKIDTRSGEIEASGWESSSYQVFWLRPDEATNQPVPIYVPKDAIPNGWMPEEDTLIEVVGLFTKKVAYASQRGPELAPVLFAAALQSPSKPSELTENQYASWIRQNASFPSWSPPKDFRAPYSLLLQTAYPLLSRLRESDWEPGDNPVPEIAVALLLEAAKFEQEIRFLCDSDQAWSLGEKLKVTYRYGIVEEVEQLPVKELTQLQQESTSLAAMDRMEQKFVYRLRVKKEEGPTDPGDSRWVVYANQVPTEWLPENSQRRRVLQQPAYLAGYCWANSVQDESSFDVFVVNRVGWKASPAFRAAGRLDGSQEWLPPLSPSEKKLVKRGWDLSYRESLRSLQSPVRPLSSIELEPLYTLLKQQESENANDSTFDPSETKSLGDWIQASLAKQGKSTVRPTMVPVQWNARIIRITRILVEGVKEREWLGTNQYFQLDCMGGIGNKSFELPTANEPIVYYKEYPVTCLVRSLPDTLPEKLLRWAADESAFGGDTSREILEADVDVMYPRLRVQCSGWLYRFWSYKTVELSEALGNQHRQVSPLMVIGSMELGSRESQEEKSQVTNSTQTWQWIIGIVGVAGVWWYVRKSMHPKKRKSPK